MSLMLWRVPLLWSCSPILHWCTNQNSSNILHSCNNIVEPYHKLNPINPKLACQIAIYWIQICLHSGGNGRQKKRRRKQIRKSFIDALHRKFKTLAEGKLGSRSGGSSRHCDDSISEKGARSPTKSRSLIEISKSSKSRLEKQSKPSLLQIPKMKGEGS